MSFSVKEMHKASLWPSASKPKRRS